MWADNETALDLLGFDIFVDELLTALTEPRLLPLTVGVLGDWGSGKSSVLKIARLALESDADKRFVCVAFSPWQYEDYDDVKSALMRAVVDACAERLPEGDQEEVGKLKRFLSHLRRTGRVAGRTAREAAPALTPMVLAAVDPHAAAVSVAAGVGVVSAATRAVTAELQKDEPPATDGAAEIADIAEFRDRFVALVDSLPGVDAVVVFIDDLDRCLPETVVDTLEAIRLFLDGHRTAYVIAANREIVESAIDSRYPELRREDGKGIGVDYLEKMLQLQVTVPPLAPAEVEVFVGLLVTQLHIGEATFAAACEQLRVRRLEDPFAFGYDLSVAGELLGDLVTADLVADLTWAKEISPILAEGLRGNPRQVKRFLNDLRWRQKTAERRKVPLRNDVLAKLMVLEQRNPEDFQRLFDWQMHAHGPIPELAVAQTAIRDFGTKVQAESKPQKAQAGGGKLKAAPVPTNAERYAGVAADNARAWASRPSISRWLGLTPDLSETDLRPYFMYFRDRLVVGTLASALSPTEQGLFDRICSDVPLVSRKALDDLSSLSTDQQDVIVEALFDTVSRKPDSPVLHTLAEMAKRIARTSDRIIEGLHRLPHAAIPPMRAAGVISRLPAGEARDALLGAWSASTHSALAAAAKAASPRKAGA